jgi:arsenate reductase (thioredoxin)
LPELDIAERYFAENYLANRMQHLENRMAMRSLGASTFLPVVTDQTNRQGGNSMKGDPRQKVLFLSTGNTVRSIFAEYFTTKIAGDRFVAHSAGSQPMGSVDPLVLQLLRDHFRIDPRGARSKSWEEFKDTRFDLIITVCDGATESCPLFPGQPTIARWNIPDATRATGIKKIDKYRDVAQQIHQRVQLLCMFPMEKVGHLVPEQRATA